MDARHGRLASQGFITHPPHPASAPGGAGLGRGLAVVAGSACLGMGGELGEVNG